MGRPYNYKAKFLVLKSVWIAEEENKICLATDNPLKFSEIVIVFYLSKSITNCKHQSVTIGLNETDDLILFLATTREVLNKWT